MRLAILVLLPLLATACANKPAALGREQLAELPRLPSPRAGTYARVQDTPGDPAVAHVMGERRWEASLSGAAAGLALRAANGTGGFTRRELRELSWQAGYPYPVLSLGVWKTGEAGNPPADVKAWLAAQPAGRDIGLVRARGAGKDIWVALAGEPMINLGVIPREVEFGQQIVVPKKAGATWWTSDGNGVARTGSLDKTLTLPMTVSGEWVIYVSDPSGELARFPVYVDEEAPQLGVLPTVNVSVASDEQVVQRTEQLVRIVREQYGRSTIDPDPLLRSAAKALLDGGTHDDVLAGLGVEPKNSVIWTCSSNSVEDCIDQVIWDPRHRTGFVDHGTWTAGYAASWTPDKVRIVGVMSRVH